jgi:hypothetical protein
MSSNTTTNLDLQNLLADQMLYYTQLREEAVKQQDWVTNGNYAGVIHGLEKARLIIEDYLTNIPV